MNAHTPGPWIYGVRKDGSIWLSIGNRSTGTHYQGDIVCSEADARLMTTAPELLEAGRRAEAFIAGFDDDNKSDDVAGMLRDLRTAIAKATGGVS